MSPSSPGLINVIVGLFVSILADQISTATLDGVGCYHLMYMALRRCFPFILQHSRVFWVPQTDLSFLCRKRGGASSFPSWANNLMTKMVHQMHQLFRARMVEMKSIGCSEALLGNRWIKYTCWLLFDKKHVAPWEAQICPMVGSFLFRITSENMWVSWQRCRLMWGFKFYLHKQFCVL